MIILFNFKKWITQAYRKGWDRGFDQGYQMGMAAAQGRAIITGIDPQVERDINSIMEKGNF